jgi:general secretion pathway protein D
MKTTSKWFCATLASAALAAQAADAPPKDSPQPAAQTAEAKTTPTDAAQTAAAKPSDNAPAATPANVNNGTNSNSDEVRMNFQDASLETVLKYLSEAAGFIINVKPGTSIRGKVNIFSGQPVSKEEAVDLLDTALIQNGLAAIRTGRRITIVNRDEAKTQHVPVFKEADPEKIPETDRIATYIIPVRFVEVGQLIKDIQPLVSMQTSMTANESGNSVIVTDTQANIRRVAEVIKFVDSGAEDFTELQVFQLKHADPTAMADLLTSLFPDDTKTGNTQSPFAGRFGRFFGGGRGGAFGGGANTGNTSGDSQNQRIKKRNRVVAVADERTTSVIVSASRDLMDEIKDVVENLDNNPKGVAVVQAFGIQNADPDQVKQVLTDIFNKNRQMNNKTSSTQTGALSSRATTQTQQQNQNSSSSRTGMNSGSRGGGPSFQ